MRRLRRIVPLLLVALIASACSLAGSTSGYDIQAQFPATFNLFPGSPVRVLGLDIGVVRDLTVSPDSDVVTVTMRVEEGVQIPADAAAIIVPESLLGERYVQFEPPYSGGDALAPGAVIPLERTRVPFEFDEVLEGLNKFVGGIDENELARLIDNLADVLDGQGGQIGSTLDAAQGAVQVLRDNDDKLIALASRLSDLNETLATRDDEMGALIQNFAALARSLADDRLEIDRALSGLLRLTDELGKLLGENRVDLQNDLATLARVGRTAQRNLDQLSLLILSSAELYRQAARVIDRDTHNWLPLLNHSDELGNAIQDSITRRLASGCGSACPLQTQQQIAAIVHQVCVPGLIACPESGGISVQEALVELVKLSPALADTLIDNNRKNDTGLAPLLELSRVAVASAEVAR